MRIGALVTDNDEFHGKAVSEYTANLCANSIGQKIFGVLAKENEKDLKIWIENQRDYYKKIMTNLRSGLLKSIPGLIVSFPEASIYLIIDFKNIKLALVTKEQHPVHFAILDQKLTMSNQIKKHRDCLLYTSPSPRDATLSRMPSSA